MTSLMGPPHLCPLTTSIPNQKADPSSASMSHFEVVPALLDYGIHPSPPHSMPATLRLMQNCDLPKEHSDLATNGQSIFKHLKLKNNHMRHFYLARKSMCVKVWMQRQLSPPVIILMFSRLILEINRLKKLTCFVLHLAKPVVF